MTKWNIWPEPTTQNRDIALVFPEQTIIVSVLREMDAEHEQREKNCVLKQTMMQEPLTRRTRPV